MVVAKENAQSYTTNLALAHVVEDFALLHKAYCIELCPRVVASTGRHQFRCIQLCMRYGFSPEPVESQKK